MHNLDSAEAPEQLSETAHLARELIRIDTTNWGQGKARPERPAAELVADYLRDIGLEPEFYEAAPGRTTVVTRVKGEHPELPALVVHGHLDVVPAEEPDWTFDPFAGTVHDGMLWGRGAVDMKNMDAMILTAIAEILNSGKRPRRDLIVVFFADEEAGGVYGSAWMVQNHPEVFAGAKTAISEVGGYSIFLGDQRAYLLQTGEKTADWVKLTARGAAGHGSRIQERNPVVTLAEAVAKLGRHQWPLTLGPTTRALLKELEAITGPGDPAELVARAGVGAGLLSSSLRTTTNPTVLSAGSMQNVVPGNAESIIDIRTFPDSREETFATIQELIGDDVTLEVLTSGPGMETPFEGELVDAVKSSLAAFDPEARVLPYLLPAGTDNQSLHSLGITGYGFAPLKLPADFDFPAMFHGVNERVPLTALDFGHRVLTDFLQRY